MGTYVRSQKIEARGTRQIDVRSDFWCEKKIDPLPLRNLGRKNSTKNRKIKYKKINLKNKVERWQSPVVG